MLHTECRTRKRLAEVRQAGYTAIAIEGSDEASEILRLTRLEQGAKVIKAAIDVPVIRADGSSFVVTWPDAQ
jgi:predicted Zn-dependent protease